MAVPAPEPPRQPSETSPLLGQPGETANGHTVDPENSPAAPDNGASEVVLAEEPSTRKLAVIMGAIWLGVFFAALGMFHCPGLDRRMFLVLS